MGSRTCARSEISACTLSVGWAAPSAAPDFFLHNSRRRRPSYGVIAISWPQPRQADGSRTCARSEISAVHFIRWLGGAERRAGFLFAQFTGGAGRSYGVIADQLAAAAASRWVSDVCSLRDFEPCTLSVGWAAPSAAPDFFLHNSPAALAGPSYGVIAISWPQPRQANGSRTSARSGFRAGTLVLYPLARVARGRRGPRWI